MTITIIPLPSANASKQNITPKYIILHCIGGQQDAALNILTQPKPAGGGVSSHYFIPYNQANTVYQLVSPERMAYHAGQSQWREDRNLNDCSIGIEFHCPNYANALTSALDWFHFEPFATAQITTGISLIKLLQQQFNIAPENILAHSDIAPWRYNQQNQIVLGKTDPGAAFPWRQLAGEGIGVWPDNRRQRQNLIDSSIEYCQRLLQQIGYNIAITGEFDLITQYVVKAFQLHYMPEHLTGKLSEQMVIYLENLVDKHYSN